MSKKLAESLDRLVLDVKWGSGAFMKDEKSGQELADRMMAVGVEMGVDVRTSLNSMEEPTGNAVGNALEVAEAVDCLRGGGPVDLREIVLDLSEKIAEVSRTELGNLLDNGSAWKKFQDIVESQGGSVSDLEKMLEIHRAPVIREIRARNGGRVTKVDANLVGQASLELGAGRAQASDQIDFRVGFDQLVKCGADVQCNEVIARVHARDETMADEAEAALHRAVAYGA